MQNEKLVESLQEHLREKEKLVESLQKHLREREIEISDQKKQLQHVVQQYFYEKEKEKK